MKLERLQSTHAAVLRGFAAKLLSTVHRHGQGPVVGPFAWEEDNMLTPPAFFSALHGAEGLHRSPQLRGATNIM